MDNTQQEVKVAKAIVDLLDPEKLSMTSKIGILEILKHSFIQAAILDGDK